jgi:hypothetical protein
MLGINLKHTLAIVTVAAGVLATAGSASAGTHQSGLVLYNGHAGLGASAYQHNQTDLEFLALPPARVTDGTSNTIMFASRAGALGGFSADPGNGTAVIESIGTKYTMSLPRHIDAAKNEMAIETIETREVFSGDAYDNEMGLRAARLLPDIDDEVL